MSSLFISAALMLLTLAAWRDVATRTIPDTISVMLFVLGVSARLVQGPMDLAVSVGSGLLLFICLMLAYARHLVGGGDVKIMATFSVGLSPLDSYRFVIATAIAGAVLGICYLLLQRVTDLVSLPRPRSVIGRVAAIEFWRIRRHGPLPYGVAIAAGGAFVLLLSGQS